MCFHPNNLKSENNNLWFHILLHTQLIVSATVDSQCLEYLGYTYNLELRAEGTVDEILGDTKQQDS